MAGLDIQHDRSQFLLFFFAHQRDLEVEAQVLVQRLLFQRVGRIFQAGIGKAVSLARQVGQPPFLQAHAVDVGAPVGRLRAHRLGDALHQRVIDAQVDRVIGRLMLGRRGKGETLGVAHRQLAGHVLGQQHIVHAKGGRQHDAALAFQVAKHKIGEVESVVGRVAHVVLKSSPKSASSYSFIC